MKQIEIIKSLIAGYSSIEQMGVVSFSDISETKKFFMLKEEAKIKPDTDYLYYYGEKIYRENGRYEEPDYTTTDKDGQTLHFYEIEDKLKKVKQKTEDLMDWCRASMETHNEGRRTMARECFNYGCSIIDIIEKEDEE